ncbi:MAG: PVC-type heme-binding CxxCH protein [Chitinophagaceae bacterium]
MPLRTALYSLFISIIILGIHCKSPAPAPNETGLFLPDDLQAELWAESPMFYNPTNMDVDSKGRIWVTEAVNYRNFNNDSTKNFHHKKGDRVMILEDTDQDGKADTAKLFVEDIDLRSPVGIAVIGNKVVVSCSPNLIVYTDENGDDIPDKKEILLTGFGGFDHDHSLHAVYAGSDGYWYFNVGNAGPHIVTDKSGWTLRSGSLYTGGTPYNTKNEGNLKSDDGKVWVGGLALRMKPDGTGLKVMGHNFRNSYEVIPDSYGNLWQNDNDDQVVTCRTSWLMNGGNAGYFSTDGTRYWQADQRPGQDMFTAHWHQEDPGVMPAGDNSGAGAPTGITINESNLLGDQYLGLLLSADAGRNTIFGYHPFKEKSGYNLGKRSNFISSLSSDNENYVWNDSANNTQKEKWFRPSDVTMGTDGAIYIADWYDPVVGGHQMKDSTGYGRIYRITPKNKKLINPNIDLRTIDGQLTALKSPAINVRNAGFEKLKQQGESVIENVKELLGDVNPYIKARAIWLLAELGDKGIASVNNLLKSENELLRVTAFKALKELSNRKTDTIGLLNNFSRVYADLQSNQSAFLQREILSSLVGKKCDEKFIIGMAAKYSGQDPWYLETLGQVMDGTDAVRSNWYHQLKKFKSTNSVNGNESKDTLLMDFAWRLHPSSAINDMLGWINNNGLPFMTRNRMITALGFINDKAAANAMLGLTKSTDKDVREQAIYWLSFRQSNDWYNLLNWSKISLNTGYERKLAAMKVKRQIILDERQSLDERKWRVQEMAEDSTGGQLLIGLAAEKKLPSLLFPFVEAIIFKNPDASVRLQAGNYFKRPGTNKFLSVELVLKEPGDALAGKEVFSKSCVTCHKVGAEGNTIGPNLSFINKKFDKQSLLDAIINPDAAIVFGYEAWLINTKEGESLYGFIMSENKKNLVLRDIAGQKHTVAVDKISLKQKQVKSLMPDPVANGLVEKDLSNVLAFLMKQ